MPSTKRNLDAFVNNKQQLGSNPKRIKTSPEPQSMVQEAFRKARQTASEPPPSLRLRSYPNGDARNLKAMIDKWKRASTSRAKQSVPSTSNAKTQGLQATQHTLQKDGKEVEMLGVEEEVTSSESKTGAVTTGSTSVDRKSSPNTSASPASAYGIEAALKHSPEAQSSPSSSLLSNVKQNRVPICVSHTGPPSNPGVLQKAKIAWVLSSSDRWRAVWKDLIPQKDIQKIRNIVRPYLHLAGISTKKFEVKYLSEGSWNRAYTASSKDAAGNTHEAIFRVAKPVMPWFKTQSEVATMEYVREHTSIPIPEVYAFDSDMRNNALGLEWIFMQKAPGEQWKTAQRHLKAPKVRCVLKRLAGWVHELEGLMFNQIGSIYRQWDSTKDGYLTYKLGPVVDQHIFKAQTECNDSVSMGPYDSTGDYASALLTAQMRDLSGSSRAEARQLNVRMAATDNRVKVDEKERRQYEQEYDLKERKKRVVREINREEKSPNNDLNITRILWRNLYNHENLCAEDRFLELDMLVSDHKYVAYLAREVRDFVKAETDIFGVEPEENLTWEEHCQTSDEEEPATPQCASENNKNLDNAIQIGLEISRLIPLVFKNEKLEPNSTYLRHWDINDENLLVDENGAVTALLDWEQLTTLPFVRKRERFMLPTLIAQTASCEVDTKTQKADGQTFKKEMRRLDPEWKKEKRPSADEQKDTRLDDQQEIISMVMKLHHMGDPESAMATKAKLQKMCIYGKPAPIF